MSTLALAAPVIVILTVAVVVLSSRLRATRDRLRRLADVIEAGTDSRHGGDPVVELEAALAAATAERAAAVRDRARLTGALDAHGDGVIVVDQDGVVVLCNEAGQRYEGAHSADVIVEDAIHALLRTALDGDRSERVLPLFGPPERVLALHASPIADGDDIVGAAAVVRDVTESVRVDRVRRDFVAAASHELKTPIGALALLAETMSDADDPVVTAQLADRIGKEAVRLGAIIEDLLDLSTIEAQERPRREQVSVRVLVAEAVDLVRQGAGTARIPISVGEVADDVDVSCDRRQIVSAIRNLLDNAIKYSEPGDVVDVGVRRSDDMVVVSVRDHGIGVPKRDLERIFERFYRVDKARARGTGGTGLGLAIVRHVASAHGGQVTVDSVEGEGSLFELQLPSAAISSPTALGRFDNRSGGERGAGEDGTERSGEVDDRAAMRGRSTLLTRTARPR